MRIVLLIPYFGTFPDNISLFLESCRFNPEFDFLFITDQKKPKNASNNVLFYQSTFEDVKKLFVDKLGKSAQLYTPYKLCDYKPTYGYVFSDLISEYDVWGHCDVDLVFGKLMHFFEISDFEKYEKMQTQGHLVFYKNNSRMNEMFRNRISYGIMFEKMVKMQEPCYFDEIMYPAICRANQVVFHENKKFADILPQYPDFQLSSMECDLNNISGQRFVWDRGELFRVTPSSKDEIMYIHLQKRPLTVFENIDESSEIFYFTPQGIFSQQKYDNSKEKPNEEQPVQYRRKLAKSISMKKIWIRLNVELVRLMRKWGK